MDLFLLVYCQEPEFNGRQVVTFHNQRDYIFVRFHRYVFAEGKGDGGKEKKTRASLQVRFVAMEVVHTFRVLVFLGESRLKFATPLRLAGSRCTLYDDRGHVEVAWLKPPSAVCRGSSLLL